MRLKNKKTGKLSQLIQKVLNGLLICYLLILFSFHTSGQLQDAIIQTTNLIPDKQLNANITIDQICFGSSSNPLNGLTVTWRSFGINDSIQWGYTNSYEFGHSPAIKRTNHAGFLYDYNFPALQADSTIFYKIFDSLMLEWTEGKSYHCSSDTTTTQFSFLVMSDSQSHLKEWNTVSTAASSNRTDFTLFSGDIVEDGSVNSNWSEWFKNGAEFLEKNLVYHTIGNHDCIGNGKNNYRNILTLPKNPSGDELFYSFTFGNAVFICLNSEEGATGTNPETQYNWLVDVLQKNQDKTWKFVWYHRPFCSAGPHSGEMYYKMDTWFQTFDDFGVDMMFSGHEHMYERSKPVQKNRTVVARYGSNPDLGRCQIVTGGAGASLHYCSLLPWIETAASKLNYCKVEIKENDLSLKAYDINNIPFDSLTIHKSSAVTVNDFPSTGTVAVFPNPSINQITIKGRDQEIEGFRIYNMQGQDFSSSTRVIHHRKNSIIVDISPLPLGTYLIRTGKTVNKIVKNESFMK